MSMGAVRDFQQLNQARGRFRAMVSGQNVRYVYDEAVARAGHHPAAGSPPTRPASRAGGLKQATLQLEQRIYNLSYHPAVVDYRRID
jgi:hypothetical protein